MNCTGPFLYGLILFLMSAGASPLFAQSGYLGDGPVKWENNLAPKVPSPSDSINNNDLIVLEEVTDFYFFGSLNEKIIRNVKFKINNEKGLLYLKHFRLPESFDQAFDAYLNQQGRRSETKLPMVREFAMNEFAARHYSHNKWYPVSLKETYNQSKRIRANGEFEVVDVPVVHMSGISVGDVVEIYYEVTFNSYYGSNAFYLTGPYPKLICEFNFIEHPVEALDSIDYVLPLNIPNDCLSKQTNKINGKITRSHKIKMSNLPGINYPANSSPGLTLPHVVADFTFYRSYQLTAKISPFKPKQIHHFDWLITTLVPPMPQTKVYDKQYTAIHKFVSTLPETGSDSLNRLFIRSFCDSLNGFRYLSANQMYYNESNLAGLHSAEHLLKRRIPEEFMTKLYQDIFAHKRLPYFLVNVQDRRLNSHNERFRAHRAYENTLFAIPYKDSYTYFIPRYNGLSYHLNELPFYFEGTRLVFSLVNFESSTQSGLEKTFITALSHRSTYDENYRLESTMVDIKTDSLHMLINTKERLTGQFSTLLRHAYRNEIIDSTVHPAYYKRCVDKPGLKTLKVKELSASSVFPFQYVYFCSGILPIHKSQAIPLKSWFSVPLSKAYLPVKPNHDFYFDFDFTDSYQIWFHFDQPCEITNMDAFLSSIDNPYFELFSHIEKTKNGDFMLRVHAVCKQEMIKQKDLGLLMEFVNELDRLNHLSLEYKKL